MEKEKTGWQRMFFKQNKVWLSMNKNGNPVEKKGKVLIKYQLDQDYEYWVNAKSVKPIDPSQSKNNKPYKTASKTKKAAGTRKISHDSSMYKDAICLYTDGAASGNPGPAGIGALLQYGKHKKEISKYIGKATNNIAELEAIKIGLLSINDSSLPVIVFTDSSYAFGVLSLSWKAKKNQALIIEIKEIIKTFKNVKFIKVKGHADNEGNNIADMLAVSAIKTFRRAGQTDQAGQ